MNNWLQNNLPINWEAEYVRMLPTALRAAGWYIQEYFQNRNIAHPVFRWIQTTLQKPAFQHLCFAYKGNVYSVLIGIETPQGHCYISQQDINNQLRECAANDLIACTILLKLPNFTPIFPDLHLVATDTKKPIILYGRKEPAKMSAWEVHSLGVQIVRTQLENEGNKLLSYCDVLHIDPQIWFEDKYGRKGYVVVNTIVGSAAEDTKTKLNHNLLMRLAEYEGYYAEVRIVDLDNMLDTTLYRDRCFSISYKGLQYIEQRASDAGAETKPIFVVRES